MGEPKPTALFETYFGKLRDHRIGNAKRHKLIGIIIAILRHMALNLLKQGKTVKAGVQAKRHLAGWNDGYLFKVIAG